MIMLLLVKYYRKRHDIRKRGITLTRNILNAINAARKDFEIESFPGDFFEHLMMGNYSDRCRLLLFKEDIDKLSGFIGYGMNGLAVICVNYKRPMGHQNFTLAHEVGHWLLHRGKVFRTMIKFWGTLRIISKKKQTNLPENYCILKNVW